MRAFLDERPVVYPIAILDPFAPPADFETPKGLPMTYLIAPDGRVPAQAYARPFRPNGKPRVSLIVGGLGLNAVTTRAAIERLPPEVTLSFVPYAENLQGWIDQARAQGHEVMLEMPMEPTGYPDNDPGPYTLLADGGAEVFLLGERGKYPPFGVAGGGSAVLNRFVYETDNGEATPPLVSKVTDVKIRRGQKVRLETPGGGGFGDPAQRDPTRVARDVRLGYVSRLAALDSYKTVLRDDGSLDADATAKVRGNR